MNFNRIIHADASSAILEIRDNSIDLVVTSPPYDDLRTYGTKESFKVAEIIQSLFGVMAPGGVVVWIVGDAVKKKGETGSSFSQALMFMNSGFILHDTMIFEKNTCSFPARASSNRYSQVFEFMFVFSKDGPPKTANLICDKKNKWEGWTNWGRQTKRKKTGELKEVPDLKPVPKFSPRNNIWKYTVSGGFGHKDLDAYEHPATFPEALAADHIRTWSNPGDLVLDPMCGSGTTCIAAKKLKRKFLGIDINDSYCRLATKRLAKC